MGRSPLRLAGAGLILAALCSVPGDAQQPDPAGAPQEPQQEGAQPPVFRTGINFVRVDVIVTDSKTGQPVSNLTQNDFEVVEDNAPQAVETFKLIELDGGVKAALEGPARVIRNDSDEELEAARDDVRLFAIFLDDYHVRRGASVSVREPIARFIETQLGPSDMLGVMYPLQAVSSVRMTRDHGKVIQSLGGFVGRKGDYVPRNRLEEQYANYPAEEVERIRNQVSFGAIRGLISHMGSLKEGRKALILISEGYSDTLPPQLRDPVAAAPGLGNPDTGNAGAGINDPAEDRRQFFADSSLQLWMRDVWDLANKNNVAIYAVDPRGLPTSEFDLSQPAVGIQMDRQYLNATMDTLRVLAEQTDGRAIVNRNDLAVGMRQIVRDTSSYYLLGYNSTQAPADGRFHEIKVRVKRPGVQVRARRGYWALTATDVARALTPRVEPPKAVENALASISVPAASYNTIRTWIGSSRGANGKTRVTLVWEPMPKVAGDRNARSEAPSRVMVTAVAPDGAPYFRGRVPEVAPGAPPGAGAAPAGASRVTFEANPGKVQLRLSVEGSSSQVLDVETREIAVPDLTAADVILGTPQLLRARTARDLQQIKANPDAVPVAARDFSRAERLVVRVPAYGPGNTAPMVSARLLNRSGQPMSDVPVGPSSAADTQEMELGLATLAPGDYILEIKAGDITEPLSVSVLHLKALPLARVLPVAAVAIAAGLGFAAVTTGQQLPQERPAVVQTVRIDAIAVDARGVAVRALTARDFELRENGKPLALDEVRFVTNEPRLIAIYLDEYQITPGASADRARESLTAFVTRDLAPRDLVVVMKPLDSLFTIRLTDDREQALRIIAGFEGRKGDYAPRTPYEETFMIGSAARIETVRSQVTISALNALSVHMATLGGVRKTLLVVSEGLDDVTRRRGQEYLATIGSVVRSANRANVSIYPIDPRPESHADGVPESGAVLQSLARDTDGRMVANARGKEELTAAIRDVAADAIAYYVLTYRAAHDDGAFHPVELRVTRAGVRVRARSGYWAPSASDRLGAQLLADANRPRVAVPLEPASRSSPLIQPWFGLSLDRDDKMRVTFVWEPSPGVPGDRLLATASRVELTVLGEGDDVLFQGPVLPTGPGMVEAPGGEPARAIFHTEPGRLRLRMKIEDGDRRQVDSDVRDIIVRDLRGRVAIGTPQFLRARTFREFRTLGGGQAVPVASREFRRTERLLIRFPAYAPDGQQPSVSARLLNRLGQPMRALDVQSADGEHQIDLMLANLANGEYQVELAVTSPAGKTTELLGFRVTG